MENINRKNKTPHQPRSVDDEEYESEAEYEDYTTSEIEGTDAGDVYQTEGTRRRRRRDLGEKTYGDDERNLAAHEDYPEWRKKKLRLLTTVAVPVFTKENNETVSSCLLSHFSKRFLSFGFPVISSFL